MLRNSRPAHNSYKCSRRIVMLDVKRVRGGDVLAVEGFAHSNRSALVPVDFTPVSATNFVNSWIASQSGFPGWKPNEVLHLFDLERIEVGVPPIGHLVDQTNLILEPGKRS